MSESRFDFLKDLVKLVPDIAMEEGSAMTAPVEEHPAEGAVPSTMSKLCYLVENIHLTFLGFRQWSDRTKRTATSSSTQPVIASPVSIRSGLHTTFKSIPSAAAAKILFK